MAGRRRLDQHPTLVSLFTGAGGLDVGLEIAGFHTVAANDFDADCVETLRVNQAARIPVHGRRGRRFLEGTTLLHCPVEELSAGDLRPIGTAEDWAPDLLAGGPPCQPFSSSGKMRSVSDPRGRLFEEFVRLADELRPRMILFENVQGLVTAPGPSGEPGEVLRMVKDSFECLGYATRFSLLNAADYGAPQRRIRCFMLASRVGSPPQIPETTHAAHPHNSLLEPIEAWVTLGEFLREQPEPLGADVVRPTPETGALLAAVPEGSGLKSKGVREATRPGGHWGYRQGMFVAARDKPARTVTASTAQDWIRLEDGTLRRLTWQECAGLQGFPAAWTFTGTKASRFRQIGNAVPAHFGIVLGAALATAVEAYRREGEQPAESAPLPPGFRAAVEYTKKEHQRNGDSRKIGRLLAAQGVADAKGLGSDELRLPLAAEA